MRSYSNLALIAVLLSCFLLSSCASQPNYKGPATYANRSGESCCSLHRQKLVYARGYTNAEKARIDPTRAYTRWHKAFPNHRMEVSDTRSKSYPTRTSYSYCQACRDALKAKLGMSSTSGNPAANAVSKSR
ncbi:MAG TPA: hypothetical protein VLE43_00910 [Candidatus Saccharimonadia bacterium]|nr:hypothetical protein [Candidatus Saccharimonadia bacterium]